MVKSTFGRTNQSSGVFLKYRLYSECKALTLNKWAAVHTLHLNAGKIFLKLGVAEPKELFLKVFLQFFLPANFQLKYLDATREFTPAICIIGQWELHLYSLNYFRVLFPDILLDWDAPLYHEVGASPGIIFAWHFAVSCLVAGELLFSNDSNMQSTPAGGVGVGFIEFDS